MSEALYNLMCVAIGFLCGAVVWRSDMVDAKANARMLERYQNAVCQLAHWCGHESAHVRIITAHIAALGDGDEPVNAGTPHGDEVCDVQGTREQLRRIDAQAREELEGLKSLMDDTEWLKAELSVRSKPANKSSTTPASSAKD